MFLGAIWNSAIFPFRANDDMTAFTLFIGGARSPELFDNDDGSYIGTVMREFGEIMKIEKDPVFISEKMWPKAIPQYSIGYIEHERYFDTFESNNPGIFLSGNYRGGISVGDCIKNSKLTVKRICEYANQDAGRR
jgi:protoporphyrinogen/coproporphyrinogen III oxidase